MSHQPGADCGGIRNLLRLRDRCHVNEETECWHWRLCISQNVPRVDIVHPTTGKRLKMRGRRAALILKLGEDLPKGHNAFALLKCKSLDCVNPDHARSGTREQEGRSLATSGRANGNYTKMKAIQEVSEKRRKLTTEQVREIRAGGKSDVAFAREFGVSPFAVWSAKKGHSYKHVPLTATSVFDWRPA